METKNQTAVDQLRDRLLKEFGFAYSDNIHEELKAMEKEQIEQAYWDGYQNIPSMKPEQYYNETFGS
jgi:HEPN domain-containing protein